MPVPDAQMRRSACYLHVVALSVAGIHSDRHLASWPEGERIEQHPTVTGIDLPRLRMLPVSCHFGEHPVLFDTCDGSHYRHAMVLERLDQRGTPQEQADQQQESDKKDDDGFHDLPTYLLSEQTPSSVLDAARGGSATLTCKRY
jgi:hypothetical protein